MLKTESVYNLLVLRGLYYQNIRQAGAIPGTIVYWWYDKHFGIVVDVSARGADFIRVLWS